MRLFLRPFSGVERALFNQRLFPLHRSEGRLKRPEFDIEKAVIYETWAPITYWGVRSNGERYSSSEWCSYLLTTILPISQLITTLISKTAKMSTAPVPHAA